MTQVVGLGDDRWARPEAQGDGDEGVARSDDVVGGSRGQRRGSQGGDDQVLARVDGGGIVQAVGLDDGLHRRAIAAGDGEEGFPPLDDVHHRSLGQRRALDQPSAQRQLPNQQEQKEGCLSHYLPRSFSIPAGVGPLPE